LPEDERIVVTLYYYDEIPIGQVAGQLGIPVKTAIKRLERARSRLRPEAVVAPPCSGLRNLRG
jgi:DNA-directed RNA polymerase specialized sigma24 family protein